MSNGDPNIVIYKLLLKDLMKNDVDLNSKLLISAKIDKET